MTLIMQKGLLNDVPQDDIEDLKNEIEMASKEVKETKMNKYLYKNSAISLMSILKALDGLSEEIRTNVDEVLLELKTNKSKLS